MAGGSQGPGVHSAVSAWLDFLSVSGQLSWRERGQLWISAFANGFVQTQVADLAACG